MAKPIFIIRVPANYTAEEYFNLERKASSLLSSDYHLIFVQNSSLDFKFELYNAPEDIDIESLKQKLNVND